MTLVPRNSWQTLEPIIDRALDLPLEDRQRLIDQLTAESPELAADLVSFLEEEARADETGFLDRQAMTSLAGMELGAYRLERPLGEGGMGTVWLARRVDGRFEGTAAVKILNLALLSPRGQERFRREGSVLARLTHPGIARLLDAGVSPSGQPYLVLENVDGRPIDVFAKEQHLPAAGVIRLFLQVLAAVGHAHTNLIVHRDLKPTNILVTDDGVVKLLDFGIAKLLDDESSPDRLAATLDGGQAFTPLYAAPEQVRGEALTTATDVYALGVLLYVLLSGRHPTGESARTPVEAVRALLETEPPRLRLGDLDNILDQALRKSPAARYQSVVAFADDLERYLQRKPVRARPNSVAYRTARFIRRNQAAVITGALVMAGLIGATGFSIGQMREARLQRDDARTQRDRAVYQEERATASSGLMEFLLQSIAPTGKAYTLQELLDLARQHLEVDYRGDPRFQARMMIELADHYFELHDRKRELVLLSRAEEMAHQSKDPETAAYAACRLAKSTADDGDVAGSEQHLARAYHLMDSVDTPVPGPRVQCLRARSSLARLQGQTDTALARAREAVALATTSEDTSSLVYLATVNELARALENDDQVRASLDVTRHVVDVLDRTGRDVTLTMLVERYNTSALLSRMGEKVAAESVMNRVLHLGRGLDPQQRAPTYATILAADLVGDLGRPDSAILAMRAALAETERQGDAPFRARAMGNLVGLLIDRHQMVQARRYLDQLATLVPATSRWRVDMLEAEYQYAMGSRAEGRRHFLDVLRTRGFPGRGRSTAQYATMVQDASLMALGDGDLAAAESLANDVLRIARNEGQDSLQSGTVGYTYYILGRVRRLQGNSSDARNALEASLTPLVNGYGPEHPRTLEVRALLDTLGRAPTVSHQ
ncbi:MAG: serine/threonine-protein kinase [Gemmatimonadota bacterium]